MRLLAVVVVCAGCGRSPLPNADEQREALSVVPSVCGIERASWSWSTPGPIPELPALMGTIRTNVNTNIFDPILSEDGLTLYITADLLGHFEEFTLTRPSLSEPFDTIVTGPDDVNPVGVTPLAINHSICSTSR